MTTTAFRTYPASPAQVSFVNSLIGKRQVPADILTAIRAEERPTSKQASAWIDLLKTYPYKTVTPFSEYVAAFDGVEDAKYAIPGQYLSVIFPDVRDSDMLFLEVKTYKGKRYLNRLHGAPGDFTRTRFAVETGMKLLQFIKGRHVEFAKLFGEHYTVCGRCAAPLTDARSREIHIGPECRKVWGL